MNIREKLVELIDNMLPHEGKTFEEALADHLIANGVTVQEWIPVSERLPKNDYAKPWWERQRYLVSLQNGTMRVATYGYKEYDWWIDSHDCVLDKKRYRGVTHWMPLSSAPKGE